LKTTPEMIEPREAIAFFEEILPRQSAWMPIPSILTFLATTSVPGHHADVALARIDKLEPGAAPTDMDVHLRGTLPRPLLVGDTVTVSVNKYEKFSGYQLKTLPLRARGAQDEALRTPARGQLVLHTKQTYTTHHGPYELKFFERIPFDEVQAMVGKATHGIVAMGPTANVSPRWMWHHEVQRGRLASFHGDGVMMKTFRNLQANKASVRVVIDFEELSGYSLVGTTEEVAPESAPAAWKSICAGFTALGFGRPSRLFRHTADRIVPIALAAR
jgi:hypothetical protein